jgi:hypothetical protein
VTSPHLTDAEVAEMLTAKQAAALLGVPVRSFYAIAKYRPRLNRA